MDIKSANMQNWRLPPSPRRNPFLYDQQTYFAITTSYCVCFLVFTSALFGADAQTHTQFTSGHKWGRNKSDDDFYSLLSIKHMFGWERRWTFWKQIKAHTHVACRNKIRTTVPFINAIYALFLFQGSLRRAFQSSGVNFSVMGFSRHQHAHGQTHVQTHASHHKSSARQSHNTQHSQDINNARNSSPASWRERGKRF